MAEALQNVVLAGFPEETRNIILPQLRHEVLTAWQLLRDEGDPITRVYFPADAIISVVSLMEDGSIAESYTAGCDGMAGSEILSPKDGTIFRSMCQVPGECYSIEAQAFRDIVEDSAQAKCIVRAYWHCLMSLMGRSAACNLLHQLVERCARWLLITHDRVQKDTFELTHDIISTMLGVHRPAVSVAAGTLQKAGLIQYSRGKITMADRAGLEAASCECYRIVADEFVRVLGGPLPREFSG